MLPDESDRVDFAPQFRRALLSWYNTHKRDLPFRNTRDPYRVWLAEVMLQQTTVATVLPYYARFLARFPDAESVAVAPEAELLTLWQGLGYYSRIRNFQRACAIITTKHGGRVPVNFSALKTLPGIGDYTAAAVASIAFDEPVAVIDGNVKRVLARLFRYDRDIGASAALKFFTAQAARLIDTDSPGDFNQAMMELGATVCRPKSPLCAQCPVGRFCSARGETARRLPVKKTAASVKVRFYSLIIRDKKSVLLKQPGAGNLIADMWELPGVYLFADTPTSAVNNILAGKITPEKLVPLGAISHSITRYRITNRVYSHAPITPVRNYQYIAIRDLPGIPVSTISRKALRKFP